MNDVPLENWFAVIERLLERKLTSGEKAFLQSYWRDEFTPEQVVSLLR